VPGMRRDVRLGAAVEVEVLRRRRRVLELDQQLQAALAADPGAWSLQYVDEMGFCIFTFVSLTTGGYFVWSANVENAVNCKDAMITLLVSYTVRTATWCTYGTFAVYFALHMLHIFRSAACWRRGASR